ncbi:MAG: hypothetical protein ACJA0Q_000280 [Saprospiraceae bacterium]|jgi:hypothetical protein
MRLILSASLLLPVLLSLLSCEKDVFETEDFNGTWTVSWIRCDNFHNKVFGEISFTVTDSTENKGIIKETLADTVNTMEFHFEFINNEQLLIDTLYNYDTTSHWLGKHTISELQEKSFLLERGSKPCEGELIKFVK